MPLTPCVRGWSGVPEVLLWASLLLTPRRALLFLLYYGLINSSRINSNIEQSLDYLDFYKVYLFIVYI